MTNGHSNSKINKKESKYYVIEDGCVACGACKVICPTHCISKGTPYKIHQEKCIRCGKCLTRCWRKVIRIEQKE